MINLEYQQQLKEMHDSEKFNRGRKTYRIVASFIQQYRPASILDFGCAQGGLNHVINELHPEIKTYGYDPGVKEFEIWPTHTVDAVISTDAMEHIEPEHLSVTLKKISDVMLAGACLRIACYPAKKHLSDGRNCHLIIQPPEWWRDQILSHMQISIVKESISVVDKRHTWPNVFGHNYDVVVEKR